MNVNEYAKQFFLYSKGWYECSNNIWDDLKKLYDIHYCDGSKADILNKAMTCAFETILDKKRDRSLGMMIEFVEKLSPNYYIRKLDEEALPYNYEDELLKLCIGIMRFAEIDNLEPEVDCNFDVLPKHVYGKKPDAIILERH